MNFLDTGIWCEYVFRDRQWKRAEAIITDADETGGVAATVLAELSYAVRRKADEETATRAVHAIRHFDGIDVVPVTADVALYAVELRDKYYDRGERELSYADAIHLATAVMTNCDRFRSGDPDFEGVDEIETRIL